MDVDKLAGVEGLNIKFVKKELVTVIVYGRVYVLFHLST